MLKAVFVAAAALAFATAARAEDAPTAPAPVGAIVPQVCERPADAERETADQHTVQDVDDAFQRDGYDGIAAHLADLQDVVDHAPACYPQYERRGSDLISRNDDTNAGVTVALMLSAIGKGQTTVRQSANPYPAASLLLGSYHNEMHHFEEAIRWLDRGLALQPHHQWLVLEKATALGQLQRYDEQVALLQEEVDSPEAAITLDRPRFLRNLGIALIDVNRLNDAEAMLNESIRLLPDNPRARAELQYIAELRAGRPGATQVMGRVTPTPPPQPK